MDNRTHASLKTVPLEDEEKVDPLKLCAAFKNAMNPDVGSATILGKLYNLRQQQHESIDDFTCKLNNTAQKLRCNFTIIK